MASTSDGRARGRGIIRLAFGFLGRNGTWGLPPRWPADGWCGEDARGDARDVPRRAFSAYVWDY